ncbi:MAG: nucleotide exchange factor GrpE [Planctomycetota bacterium]
MSSDTPSPEPLADPQQAEAEATRAPAADLEKKAKERDEYYNRYLRAVADFENFQKRNRREQERYREDAVRDVMKDLVIVLDNLDLALANAAAEDPVAKGVALVKGQLLRLMAARGAEPLGTKAGEPFDPDRHEAVMAEPAPGLAKDEIGMVLREGYKLGSTILRPASVQVKKSAPAS